jgi:hypothetical protein
VKVVTLAKLKLFPGEFDSVRWPVAQGAPKLFNLLKIFFLINIEMNKIKDLPQVQELLNLIFLKMNRKLRETWQSGELQSFSICLKQKSFF